MKPGLWTPEEGGNENLVHFMSNLNEDFCLYFDCQSEDFRTLIGRVWKTKEDTLEPAGLYGDFTIIDKGDGFFAMVSYGTKCIYSHENIPYKDIESYNVFFENAIASLGL